MALTRQVNRVLHDEHMHVKSLLERLGDLLRHDDPARLEASDGLTLLQALVPVLGGDLERHFKFEENDLFPVLAERGDDDIVALLNEDHDLLLPLAAELLGLVRRGLSGELDSTAWPAFRRLGLEFVERQTDHIEKEEMALLPLLEGAIDEEADLRIWTAYSGQ